MLRERSKARKKGGRSDEAVQRDKRNTSATVVGVGKPVDPFSQRASFPTPNFSKLEKWWRLNVFKRRQHTPEL